MTKIEKAVEEVEEILKEFHEEVLIDMSLNNIISDTQEKWITNFFRKALLTAHEQGIEEGRKVERRELVKMLNLEQDASGNIYQPKQ